MRGSVSLTIPSQTGEAQRASATMTTPNMTTAQKVENATVNCFIRAPRGDFSAAPSPLGDDGASHG